MIRTDRGILVIGIYFVSLHELMELGFGVFYRPISVYSGVYINVLSIFHSLLIGQSIHVRIIILAVLVVRPVCLTDVIRAHATLEHRFHRRRDFRFETVIRRHRARQRCVVPRHVVQIYTVRTY